MTKKDDFKTVVVFRKFKEDENIIALFPEKRYSNSKDYSSMSYMHVGQHSGADYNYCVSISTPATPKEYESLKRELESIGYNLNIKKRYVRK